MAAGYSDQYLDQGSTFTTQLTLTDNYGNAYNLSGFSVASQAKQSYISPNVAINFSTTVLDAATGVIGLSLDAANSSNVPAGTLVYDVVVKDSSNNISRVLEGRIFVNPGVTGVNSSYGFNV